MASEMEERGCGIRPCTDSSIICVLMANSFIWFAYRKGIPSEQQLSWILHYFLFLKHVPNLWYSEYRYERLLTCEHNQ